MTACVTGTSTRKVDDLVRALGCESITIVAPARIGVREMTLATILGDTLAAADSIVLSASHRIGQALAEVVTFAAVWVFRAIVFVRDAPANADLD